MFFEAFNIYKMTEYFSNGNIFNKLRDLKDELCVGC